MFDQRNQDFIELYFQTNPKKKLNFKKGKTNKAQTVRMLNHVVNKVISIQKTLFPFDFCDYKDPKKRQRAHSEIGYYDNTIEILISFFNSFKIENVQQFDRNPSDKVVENKGENQLKMLKIKLKDEYRNHPINTQKLIEVDDSIIIKGVDKKTYFSTSYTNQNFINFLNIDEDNIKSIQNQSNSINQDFSCSQKRKRSSEPLKEKEQKRRKIVDFSPKKGYINDAEIEVLFTTTGNGQHSSLNDKIYFGKTRVSQL